jgi:hypothetical protein
MKEKISDQRFNENSIEAFLAGNLLISGVLKGIKYAINAS